MKRLLTWPNGPNLLAFTLVGLSFTIAFEYVFGLIHRPMAPVSIVDFEYVWTAERLAAMTAGWGAAGTAAAQLSLWVDYLFMPVYVLLASGLVLLTARAAVGRWQSVGLWLALAPLGAWACDAVENAILLNSLPPAAASTALLTLSGVLSSIKFGLLIVCVVYVLAALVPWGLRRLKPGA